MELDPTICYLEFCLNFSEYGIVIIKPDLGAFCEDHMGEDLDMLRLKYWMLNDVGCCGHYPQDSSNVTFFFFQIQVSKFM